MPKMLTMVRTYCYWFWVRTTRWLRKVWLRFDLSKPVNLLAATLTLHTAKDIKRESWDIHLHGLMSGFKPTNGIQGIDWREETLTWNNAQTKSAAVKMNGRNSSTSGKIRVDPITEPVLISPLSFLLWSLSCRKTER